MAGVSQIKKNKKLVKKKKRITTSSSLLLLLLGAFQHTHTHMKWTAEAAEANSSS